jgi:hypothetical protein
MKNKYSQYGIYIDINYYINDYVKEYSDWTIYETKEEKLAREKAEKRNDKIDQILELN